MDFVLKSSDQAFSSPNRVFVSEVTSWLKRYGFAPALHGNALAVTGNSLVLKKLLHTTLFCYGKFCRPNATKHMTYAFGRPYVPSYIAHDLLAVIGLNNAATLAPSVNETLPGKNIRGTSPVSSESITANPVLAKDKPASALSPSPASTVNGQSGLTACQSATNFALGTGFYLLSAVGNHYGVSQLLSAGDQGAGVTIGVAELGTANSGDIAAYDQCFGLSTGNVSTVNVDGGGPAGLDTLEADSDIEQLQTNAPQAKIISYNGPNLDWSSLYDVVNAMVNPPAGDPLPQVISISYGGCESESGDISALDALFQQAAAQGQSVFVASGDAGAEACRNEPDTLAVNYPGSDPNVTSVGGSAMINSGVSNGSGDVVWNDCQNATSQTCSQQGFGGAGGGGVSSLFPEPGFQSAAVGTINGPCGSSGGCRAAPDISANALDNAVYYDGSFAGVDGTSLSTPLIAAITADVIPTCSTPIGDLAPRLYRYYSEFGYQQLLNPITSGNNDWTDAFGGAYYQAKAAYNLATGLGTLNAPALACPSVSSLSSAASPPGSEITINGTNLSAASVMFGTQTANITSRTSSSLQVIVPAGQGGTSLEVSNPTGSAPGINFYYSDPAVIMNTPSPYPAPIGSDLNLQVSSYGNPTASLSEQGNLPAGTAFTASANGTATISGTPAPGSQGSYTITLTATNSLGSQSKSFTVTVGNAPNIAAPSSINTGENNTLNVILAEGNPQPVITEDNGSSLPSGLSIVDNMLSGTVGGNAGGNYVLNFTANNSFGSAESSVTISVASPVATTVQATTTTTTPPATTTTTQSPVVKIGNPIYLIPSGEIITNKQIALRADCPLTRCNGHLTIGRGKMVLASGGFTVAHGTNRLIVVRLNGVEQHRVASIASKLTALLLRRDIGKNAQKMAKAQLSLKKTKNISAAKQQRERMPLAVRQVRIVAVLTIYLSQKPVKRETISLMVKPAKKAAKKKRVLQKVIRSGQISTGGRKKL